VRLLCGAKWIITRSSGYIIFSSFLEDRGPVPVAAQSKTWVCGRSIAETVGSNPAGRMDVCLFWVFCPADHSSRGVLPTVACCVWSRNLVNEEVQAHWRTVATKERKRNETVAWCRRSVAGILPQRPAFNPRSINVRSVVDKLIVGQVFLRVLQFPLSSPLHQWSRIFVYMLLLSPPPKKKKDGARSLGI
jgi:hypothetical protein